MSIIFHSKLWGIRPQKNLSVSVSVCLWLIKTCQYGRVFVRFEFEIIHKMSQQRTQLQNVMDELVGISKISPEIFQAMIEY